MLSASRLAQAAVVSSVNRRLRTYETTINHGGFAYTRSYQGAMHDSYRCSVYRSTGCRARLLIAKGANRRRPDGVTTVRAHTCTGSAPAATRDDHVPFADRLAQSQAFAARLTDNQVVPAEHNALPTSSAAAEAYTDEVPEEDLSFEYQPSDDEHGGHGDGLDDDACEADGRSEQDTNSSRRSQVAIAAAAAHDGDDSDTGFIEVINATEDMREETDRLTRLYPQASPLEIWGMIHDEFYNHHTNEISSGLTKDQVMGRVKRLRRESYGTDEIQKLKDPALAFVKGTKRPYVQFIDAFFDDGELQHVIGLANPALLRLLNYRQTALFIDGTFRSVPRSFYQCLVVMVYDQATDMYVPVFHVLLTGKTEVLYGRALSLIKMATGGKIDPATVTCDFELALHNAVKDHFHGASLIGCFFHWKQAIRRWLLKQKMPEAEVKVALSPGFLDKLTVTPHHQIEEKAIPWIKQRLAASCRRQRLGYSTAIWDKFWVYFSTTWLRRFKPSSWNYANVDTAIVNRTNNPLERYNRSMNGFFPQAHPSLATFVSVIEEKSRKAYTNLLDIQAGRARPPAHAPPYIPTVINFN